MIIIDKNAKREVQIKYPDKTRVLFPNLDDGYISSNDIVIPNIDAPISDGGVAEASINDGAEGGVISKLVIGIEPVQDLHGQSNPYPPGGGANKLPNALPGTTPSGGLTLKSNGDGTYVLTGSTSGSSEQVYFDLVGEYTLQEGDYLHIGNSEANANIALNLDNSGGESIGYWGVSPTNRIAQISNDIAGQKVGRIRLYITSNTSNINITFKPMICQSSSAIDFAPYSNICHISGWSEAKVTRSGDNSITDTYTIDLNGTRYGGTLDVTTGVLTVDRAILNDFTGLTANGTSSTGAYRYKLVVTECAGYTVKPVISNVLKYNAEFNGRANDVYNSAGWMNIFLNASTAENAIDFLEDNNTVIVYPLAEPITVQLTPTEITTLLGNNTISADCGNILEMSYSANMNIRLQDLLNEKLDKPTTPGTLGQVLTSDGEGGQTWETQE